MRALVRGWLERQLKEQGQDGGRLLYLDHAGKLHDLGPAEADEYLWATQVAYRHSRERAERQRLSGIRARLERIVSITMR